MGFRLLAVLLLGRMLETSHIGSLYLQLPAQSLLGGDGGDGGDDPGFGPGGGGGGGGGGSSAAALASPDAGQLVDRRVTHSATDMVDIGGVLRPVTRSPTPVPPTASPTPTPVRNVGGSAVAMLPPCAADCDNDAARYGGALVTNPPTEAPTPGPTPAPIPTMAPHEQVWTAAPTPSRRTSACARSRWRRARRPHSLPRGRSAVSSAARRRCRRCRR